MNWLAFWQWVVKYRMVILSVLAVGIIYGGLAYIYWRGGEDREDKIETEVLKEDVKTHEVYKEIRNNRADTPAIVNRLRDHKF